MCGSRIDVPRDDLTGHFPTCIRKLSRQTEIRDLQLPIRRNQQIVWFEVLDRQYIPGVDWKWTYSMQHTISMYILQSSERHR